MWTSLLYLNNSKSFDVYFYSVWEGWYGIFYRSTDTLLHVYTWYTLLRMSIQYIYIYIMPIDEEIDTFIFATNWDHLSRLDFNSQVIFVLYKEYDFNPIDRINSPRVTNHFASTRARMFWWTIARHNYFIRKFWLPTNMIHNTCIEICFKAWNNFISSVLKKVYWNSGYILSYIKKKFQRNLSGIW